MDSSSIQVRKRVRNLKQMNLINSKEEIDRDKYQGLRDYKIKYGNRNKAS